jgi:hypothetical protein
MTLSKKYLITQEDIDVWKTLKHLPSNEYYEQEFYKLLDLFIKFINDKQTRCIACVDDWRFVRDNVAQFFGAHQDWAQEMINQALLYASNDKKDIKN